jgi:NADH:ubiquinone reductase (H+-translocating)
MVLAPTPVLDDPEVAGMEAWPHVVVVGGGFAGLKICHSLSHRSVRVTLIDKRNFNLFQPLLYQVASGLVSAADVASPLRQMVGQAPNVRVLLGEVTDIDPGRCELICNGRRIGYDRLVLATGSGSAYFGHEEWRPLAPPMKVLEHAQEIRRRLLTALEEAEQTTDRARQRYLQTVVVVGAGPAGCELAGSVVEMMQSAIRRDFKRLDPSLCRVVLVDAVQRVLPTMDSRLAAEAAEYLRSQGVVLLLNSMVEGIEPGRVRLRREHAPRQIEAATTSPCRTIPRSGWWATPVATSHRAKSVPCPAWRDRRCRWAAGSPAICWPNWMAGVPHPSAGSIWVQWR